VNDKTAWEKARDEAVKRGNGNRATIKAALDGLGSAPLSPLEPLMTCPEPTFEGLCKLFAVEQPSLGIFATEGGQFVGGHGMSDDAKLRTAAGLSKLWDDGETRRVRSGDGAIMLRGRRLTVHLMAQPDVARMMLNDRLLAVQGLLSRLLITAPDSAAGLRPLPGKTSALTEMENPDPQPGTNNYYTQDGYGGGSGSRRRLDNRSNHPLADKPTRPGRRRWHRGETAVVATRFDKLTRSFFSAHCFVAIVANWL
jgi:uncharacterized protein DUF3987